MFDGWILKGEKFPSSLDHPLTTSQRYVDFCESGNIQRSIRSSQNVAMIFFRIQQAGNGFTVTVKKNSNLFRKSAFHTSKGGLNLGLEARRMCWLAVNFVTVVICTDMAAVRQVDPCAGLVQVHPLSQGKNGA